MIRRRMGQPRQLMQNSNTVLDTLGAMVTRAPGEASPRIAGGHPGGHCTAQARGPHVGLCTFPSLLRDAGLGGRWRLCADKDVHLRHRRGEPAGGSPLSVKVTLLSGRSGGVSGG